MNNLTQMYEVRSNENIYMIGESIITEVAEAKKLDWLGLTRFKKKS